jgi:hypothetical protein
VTWLTDAFLLAAFVWDQGIIPPYLTADSDFPQSASILKRYPKSQAVHDVFKSVTRGTDVKIIASVIRCSARARSEMFWYLCWKRYNHSPAGVSSPVDFVFSTIRGPDVIRRVATSIKVLQRTLHLSRF